MAYFSQEKKKELSPRIKNILKKYGLKGSLSVHHYSLFRLTIKSGAIDFFGLYKSSCGTDDPTDVIDVNQYWYPQQFHGQAFECLSELFEAMNVGNHNNSDIQTDYFDVGWYVSIRIGTYEKPYTLTKS